MATTITNGVILHSDSTIYRQYIPWRDRSDIWIVNHNLNQKYVDFYMYDDRFGGEIRHDDILALTVVDENSFMVQFNEERWGKIIVDSNVELHEVTENDASSFWSINHELNHKYVRIVLYDSVTDSLILPSAINEISYDTKNNVSVIFNDTVYGFAVINKDIIEYDIDDVSDVWIVEHNLGIRLVSIRCFDNTGEITEDIVEINYIDDNSLSVTFNTAHSGTLQLYPYNYIDPTGRGRWSEQPVTEIIKRPTSNRGYMSLIHGGGSYDSPNGQRHVHDIHSLGRPQKCICTLPYLMSQLRISSGNDREEIAQRIRECVDDAIWSDVVHRYGPFDTIT